MSTYLDNLKESVITINPNLSGSDIDFGNSEYSNETIGELLKEAGFNIEDELLNEGILDMPTSKIKSISSTITKNINSVDGFKKIRGMFGGLVSKFSISDIKGYSIKLAASKGIDEKATLDSLSVILRYLAASTSVLSILNPLCWFLVIIALIKSGDLSSFRKNIDDTLREIKKATRHGTGPFDSSLSAGAKAWVLFILAFPTVGITLLPGAIFGIISFIKFIVAFLDQFGK